MYTQLNKDFALIICDVTIPTQNKTTQNKNQLKTKENKFHEAEISLIHLYSGCSNLNNLTI